MKIIAKNIAAFIKNINGSGDYLSAIKLHTEIPSINAKNYELIPLDDELC